VRSNITKAEQAVIIKFSICLRMKYNMLQRTVYDANRFTIRKVNYKYLESFESGAGERCRRSFGTIV
jgi:hypothetical protein